MEWNVNYESSSQIEFNSNYIDLTGMDNYNIEFIFSVFRNVTDLFSTSYFAYRVLDNKDSVTLPNTTFYKKRSDSWEGSYSQLSLQRRRDLSKLDYVFSSRMQEARLDEVKFFDRFKNITTRLHKQLYFSTARNLNEFNDICFGTDKIIDTITSKFNFGFNVKKDLLADLNSKSFNLNNSNSASLFDNIFILNAGLEDTTPIKYINYDTSNNIAIFNGNVVKKNLGDLYEDKIRMNYRDELEAFINQDRSGIADNKVAIKNKEYLVNIHDKGLSKIKEYYISRNGLSLYKNYHFNAYKENLDLNKYTQKQLYMDTKLVGINKGKEVSANHKNTFYNSLTFYKLDDKLALSQKYISYNLDDKKVFIDSEESYDINTKQVFSDYFDRFSLNNKDINFQENTFYGKSSSEASIGNITTFSVTGDSVAINEAVNYSLSEKRVEVFNEENFFSKAELSVNENFNSIIFAKDMKDTVIPYHFISSYRINSFDTEQSKNYFYEKIGKSVTFSIDNWIERPLLNDAEIQSLTTFNKSKKNVSINYNNLFVKYEHNLLANKHSFMYRESTFDTTQNDIIGYSKDEDILSIFNEMSFSKVQNNIFENYINSFNKNTNNIFLLGNSNFSKSDKELEVGSLVFYGVKRKDINKTIDIGYQLYSKDTWINSYEEFELESKESITYDDVFLSKGYVDSVIKEIIGYDISFKHTSFGSDCTVSKGPIEIKVDSNINFDIFSKDTIVSKVVEVSKLNKDISETCIMLCNWLDKNKINSEIKKSITAVKNNIDSFLNSDTVLTKDCIDSSIYNIYRYSIYSKSIDISKNDLLEKEATSSSLYKDILIEKFHKDSFSNKHTFLRKDCYESDLIEEINFSKVSICANELEALKELQKVQTEYSIKLDSVSLVKAEHMFEKIEGLKSLVNNSELKDVYIEYKDKWLYSEFVKPPAITGGGVDELLLPGVKFDYKIYEDKIFDKKTLKPINPVKVLDDNTFISSLPIEHIFSDRKAIVPYASINVQLLRYLIEVAQTLWIRKAFKFGALDLKSAMNMILDDLTTFVNITVDGIQRKQAMRVVKLIEWYAEACVNSNSKYKVSLNYGPVSTDFFKGYSSLPFKATNMYIDNEGFVLTNSVIGESCEVIFTIANPTKTSLSAVIHISKGDGEVLINGEKVGTLERGVNKFSFDIEKLDSPNNLSILYDGSGIISVSSITVNDMEFVDLSMDYEPVVGEGNKFMDALIKHLTIYEDVLDGNKEYLEEVKRKNYPVTEVFEKLHNYMILHHEDKVKGKRLTIKK